MIKNVMYVHIPELKGLLDKDLYYKVDVYSQSYNLNDFAAMKANALKMIAEEYAYEDEKLYGHIVDKGDVPKYSVESCTPGDIFVDPYSINSLETLDDVPGTNIFL